MSDSIRIKLPPERISSLKELQVLTKTQFKDISLLHLAFVHRSFANEDSNRYLSDNERLEFLGDSVLGILAAEFLYRSLPKGKEGKLAKLKSKMVSAPAIAKLARVYRFPEYLLLGKGERDKGEANANLQADCFEAFLGALYLDQGLESCRKFLTPHFQMMEKAVDDAEETKDYKTILQEFCQKKWKKLPEYSVMKEEGPDHDKEFLISVVLEKNFQATGEGKNKRRAEQMAAKAALRFLKIL
ncbi:ribonuclease III [Leptospira meyeri]|uniref:ribonuclease III n=1 Tax=Leptospira meyeri TaxID=29508 RepID=UPI000C2B15DA|nr:ribonuclease III [Leptospira meyeri]PKA24168.1 ribonuclease III [Leptospira sp. mixed culture ATI2-C-A1]MCW7487544.1 ribonuclease III [Leptospira meyeri]PJZ79644.1 ribonuclease III [Leptospira meyeri]PJZ95951.1 ribonuclease III [Leptospira meyeri]PKA12042.1 ribonuclease III [Leptospira meyeri]